MAFRRVNVEIVLHLNRRPGREVDDRERLVPLANFRVLGKEDRRFKPVAVFDFQEHRAWVGGINRHHFPLDQEGGKRFGALLSRKERQGGQSTREENPEHECQCCGLHTTTHLLQPC